MKNISLKSWAFPHVIETALAIAREGSADLSDPRFLVENGAVRVWECLDSIARDPKKLHLLTTSPEAVLTAIPEGANGYLDKDWLEELTSCTRGGLRLNQMSLAHVGYTRLADAETMGRMKYAIACTIQGDGVEVDDVRHRQLLSTAFLGSLRGYGWSAPEVQEELARFELEIGHWTCLQFVALALEHKFDFKKWTLYGLKKYGVQNIHGIAVCYWCSGIPCVCGSRKSDMKASRRELTEAMVWTQGVPEMDRFMWSVYGGSRNTAISALAGAVRAYSEGGGELGFLHLIQRAGGTLGQLKAKLGPLYLEETRHDNMCTKELVKGTRTLDEGFYFEGADAAISWPCLVTCAFGLDHTRAVKRGLEYMARVAGVDLTCPSDLTQTIPVG